MNLKLLRGMTLSLFVLILASCSSVEDNLWLKTPDWSRGVYVGGTSVLEPVSFVDDSNGETYFFLVELNDESSNYSFDLVRINPNSEEVDHFKIFLGELQNVKQPEIVRDENADLRLFWITSEGLYTLVVSEKGVAVGEPVLLSGNDVVANYDIARAPDGSITLWYAGSRRTPGIHALESYDGSAQGVLIDPDGVRVRLRFDEVNQLHALWVYYPFGFDLTEVRYGMYDSELGEFSLPYSPVISLSLGTQKRLDDLALGVDDSNVYISWVTSIHAGMQAGAIEAYYQSFPIGESGQGLSSQSIRVPTVYSLEFDDSSGDLRTGNRVSLSDLNVPTTPKVQDFRTNVTAAGEMVLAVRSPAEHQWRKTREQVNLVYFDQGSLKSYQPLTFTTPVSTYPYVLSDPDGYVSLTWLERSSSNPYHVYYASTDPQISSRFATLSTGEYLGILYTTLFGILIGALLAPIAAGVWLLAPLAVLALFSSVRRFFPSKVSGYISVAAVVAAVGVIWFAKLAVFPMMMEYVPFSAWIPGIPILVGEILRLGVPILTILISSFTAWHFTYRRGNDSSLYFIMIYVAVDALITTSIYAVLIYGTYVQ